MDLGVTFKRPGMDGRRTRRKSVRAAVREKKGAGLVAGKSFGGGRGSSKKPESGPGLVETGRFWPVSCICFSLLNNSHAAERRTPGRKNHWRGQGRPAASANPFHPLGSKPRMASEGPWRSGRGGGDRFRGQRGSILTEKPRGRTLCRHGRVPVTETPDLAIRNNPVICDLSEAKHAKGLSSCCLGRQHDTSEGRNKMKIWDR